MLRPDDVEEEDEALELGDEEEVEVDVEEAVEPVGEGEADAEVELEAVELMLDEAMAAEVEEVWPEV